MTKQLKRMTIFWLHFDIQNKITLHKKTINYEGKMILKNERTSKIPFDV